MLLKRVSFSKGGLTAFLVDAPKMFEKKAPHRQNIEDFLFMFLLYVYDFHRFMRMVTETK